MNYRHHYHAGNFADVFKHVILLELVRWLQRKEKPLLYLDTHAGRGAYDLAVAARGGTLVRQPEWPDGIGRVEAAAAASTPPPPVARYLAAVRTFAADFSSGGSGTGHSTGSSAVAEGPGSGVVRPYPGSPCLVQARLRAQDRMVLCERHPEDHAALAARFMGLRRVRVESNDGYAAVAAHLPPRERRALVLIDPPYETRDEFSRIAEALAEGLRRLPAGTYAVWYPLTERARADALIGELAGLGLPPTWTAELTVAGADEPVKMRGSGLLVVNPPWQVDRELGAALDWLGATLGRSPAAGAVLRWIVPEHPGAAS